VTLVLGWSLGRGHFAWGDHIVHGCGRGIYNFARAGHPPEGKLEQLLELESGSNDPMAIFLTIGFTSLVADPPRQSWRSFPCSWFNLRSEARSGWLMGKGGAWLLNSIQLKEQGLYSVLTTALVVLVYGMTASLGGNGFLAVYLAGIVMGNTPFVHRRSLTRYHEGLSWLLQITMFLVLGLQVFPSRLDWIDTGWPFAGRVPDLRRPAGKHCAFASAFPVCALREKAMVAWVGLRGAAPIVLATFPLLAGLEKADLIFNLIFFVVLVSVLLQGTTLPLVGGCSR
jgi:potassium/hydrogen antiporter